MPRFLYTIIFIAVLSWLVTGIWLFIKSPESVTNILFLLFVVYFAVTFTFSIPLYFIEIKKVHHAGLEKSAYHKALKISAFIGFLLTGTLALKAFDLINVFNYGLFLALCVAIFPFLLKKR